MFLIAFLLLFLGSLVWPLFIDPGTPLLSGSTIGLQIAIGLCYVCWWLILSSFLKRARSGPIQVLWHVLLTALLFTVLLIPALQIPGGVTEDLQALTPTVHLKNGIIGLLVASFSFIVLLRLRALVRRRRQAAGRNWSRMIWSMVLLSLSIRYLSNLDFATFIDTLKLVLAIVLAGATVAYIAVNAFRVSWTGQLRGKHKLFAMVLGVTLLGVILFLLSVLTTSLDPPQVGTWSIDDFPRYLRAYSLPLAVFSALSLIFGFLYILSSVLTLLFNIPSSADIRITVDEMGVLDNLTSLMKSTVDIGEVAERIVEQTVEGYQASAAWIALLDYENEPYRPTIAAAQNISPKQAAAAIDTVAFFNEVAGTKEVLVIQQVATDYRSRTSLGGGMESLAVAPLGDAAEVSGALFIVRDEAYGFEKDDIAAIRMLTSYSSLALEHARLVESTIERERLERELAIAREVQLRLLPRDLPEFAQMGVAASSSPAQEVGGDFYDLIKLDNGDVAIIVADVSGKGTSAAFYMAILQGIFRSAARVTPSPREFLIQANRAISDCLDTRVFVTAVYGLIDPSSGSLYLARAGHCPAVLADENGEVREWRSSGLGLGLNQGDLFKDSLEVVHHEFALGDVIVLYTDGLIEHRNNEGEDYGAERLIASISKYRNMDARALHDALIRDLDIFTGEKPSFADDLTLLVLKWHRPPV